MRIVLALCRLFRPPPNLGWRGKSRIVDDDDDDSSAHEKQRLDCVGGTKQTERDDDAMLTAS